jgi:hypothetical protein
MDSAAIVSLVARPSSARILQNQLKGVETSYDDALADSGEMIGKVIRAAREGDVPLARIQKSLRLLNASITKGLDARADAHRFHQDLRMIMGTLDMRELGWGDTGSSPASIDQCQDQIVDTARVLA